MGTVPALDPLEVYSGVIVGDRRSATPLPDSPALAGTPREVLEALLLEPLRHSPCRVAFSGGRDSSAILAAATYTARKHGLPDPVPMTARLEDYPRTWETEWQQMTVSHLGLRDWETVSITTELDALGAVATAALRRYGLYWPSQAHSIIVFAQHAGSGSLVTGGGGDEVFTPWSGRRLPMRQLAKVRPRRSAAKWMAYYALPQALRVRVYQARFPMRIPWLQPDAERQVVERRRARALDPTRAVGESLERMLASRYLELVRGVLDTFATDHGVRLFEPFYDPRFVRAIAAAAPEDGYPTRSGALRAQFGDLLPDEIWTRGTKAVFTEVAWGPEARKFAEAWDGKGVDRAIVDIDRLQEEWAKPRPDARTLTCLAKAWLAAQSPT